jgi:hypothetical protein
MACAPRHRRVVWGERGDRCRFLRLSRLSRRRRGRAQLHMCALGHAGQRPMGVDRSLRRDAGARDEPGTR